ncbi:hypothetical protein A1O3_06832 [Capronia epimyces CBS 606.96]|uniref:Uncharacterized protein n=1 Tax=Capronia epimyces CBS 606.96 TaxID=1182542 RepID=W9Y055_9EURO|nr:uncharacterized protein A1O3_06832 [Capronia epimyces CBS 606.96]EXJ83015.1 hypothetical protein A1O3_06832 [Capronia epimyces CBS 606.96]
MATNMHGFSLFPSTVPKIAMPNPHKKAPSMHRISLITSPESTLTANGESTVIKMEDKQSPVPCLPSHPNETKDGTLSPENIGRAVTTMSPIDGRTPTQLPHGRAPSPAAGTRPLIHTARYSPSIYQSPVPSHSSPEASFSTGSAFAATLVPTAPSTAVGKPVNNKTPVDPSPIVPIRSMFPTYDPSLPLQQQAYVPQPPLPARLSGLPGFRPIPRDNYRSSLSVPFAIPTPRTAPASVLSFPSDAMSVNIGPRISTQRELEKLWEASHGAEPGFAIRPFDLEMARTEEATFVFGSHPSLPFYTLQTYDSNEIAISKTCPRNPASTQDVVLCPLEPAPRRQSPNDGLVAFIFPKLAAMMAINQSASLAREHNLAPTDRDDIEAQAVRRAAKQEACRLYFNVQEGFYELEHPAIGRDAMGGDFAIKSPVSPPPTTVRSRMGQPVLHITISTDSPLPTIQLIDPNVAHRSKATTPMTSAGTGLRHLSTIPQPETTSPSQHPPLATLDLTSQLLHVDANAILELMPSLFSIDCIVSAIMAVAISDATTNPAMGSMEIWKPRPVPASRLGVGGRGLRDGIRAGSIKSYAGSVFYATIAEREEAEEEAKLMREAHDRDIRGSSSKGKGSRTWFGFRKQGASESDESKKRSKTKKIVVSEFDLEKLGHYQSGDREGDELPAVTRSALSMLVVGLKLLVWVLTMIAQVLAWVLVNVSRVVTSDKF